MRVRLIPHPSAVKTPFTSLTVNLRRRGARLLIAYELVGTVSKLIVPVPATPARTDELWKTTCFELFLCPRAGDAYYEFNLSPSSHWAAYRFEGYRRGMANAAMATPLISTSIMGRTFKLTAEIDLSSFSVSPSARLGLTAVLVAKDGAKSYWALAHGGDKPDFHRADGFIARLPFESRT